MPKAGIVCDAYKKQAFLDAFKGTDFTPVDCELPKQLKGKDLIGMQVHYFDNSQLEKIAEIVKSVEDSFNKRKSKFN